MTRQKIWRAQQEEPIFCFRKIVHQAEVLEMLLERKRRADHQKSFRPGEAFKRDAKRFTDHTARAISANEPPAAHSFPIREADRHAIFILHGRFDRSIETHIH